MFHKLSYLSRLLLEVKLGNIRKRGYGGRWVRNIYSVSKTLIGLARNETNDELLFPRLDFFFPRPKGGQLFSRGRRPRLNN